MQDVDETYKWFRKFFAWALLAVGGCGIPVNLLPFWLLWRKRTLSNFHILLVILSISDLVSFAEYFFFFFFFFDLDTLELNFEVIGVLQP